MRIEVEVCNVCQDVKREVTPIKIPMGQNNIDIALCDEHLQLLVEMFAEPSEESDPEPGPPAPEPAKRATKASPRRPGRKPSAIPVLTEEQVQNLR